ncbi:MAG: ASKHA domain-containing protein, partial [Planctomycetia bacterium]|nr:ASKHA domain-containing protein [Planctomycetia bacterium]
YNEVIGDRPVVGICGSAIPDAVAALLDAGILSSDGRICTEESLSDGWSGDLRDRITTDGRHRAFVLAHAGDSADRTPVLLTQRDVREIQMASGAIRTGIELLLRRAGLVASQIAEVILAGGFGSVLARDRVRRIGMLPPEVPSDRIHVVGNSALEGAVIRAGRPESAGEVRQIARRVTIVDLSTDPGFQRTFTDFMRFPVPED